MSASTRRLLLAILAWPAGFAAAIVWMFVSSDPVAYDPGPNCTIALAIAPGLFATIHWWRNCAKPS